MQHSLVNCHGVVQDSNGKMRKKCNRDDDDDDDDERKEERKREERRKKVTGATRMQLTGTVVMKTYWMMTSPRVETSSKIK